MHLGRRNLLMSFSITIKHNINFSAQVPLYFARWAERKVCKSCLFCKCNPGGEWALSGGKLEDTLRHARLEGWTFIPGTNPPSSLSYLATWHMKFLQATFSWCQSAERFIYSCIMIIKRFINLFFFSCIPLLCHEKLVTTIMCCRFVLSYTRAFQAIFSRKKPCSDSPFIYIQSPMCLVLN